MHSKKPVDTTMRTAASRATGLMLAAALVLVAGIAMPRVSDAAEFKLSGTGNFKPPSAAQLAALPVDLGFSRADLESGAWSFSLRYDDSLPDKDPDPYAARYVGAIRAARLVIGGTTLDLPAERTEIVVSDGGGAFPNREMIRLEARMATPSGTLRLSWVQANQQAKSADLRGPAGVLQGDALPAAAMLANLNTASAFDKYLELRIDRSAGDPKPLLYLSSSKLTVSAGPAVMP
jgi:hypothetical protein